MSFATPPLKVIAMFSGYLESGGSNGQVLGAMISPIAAQVRFVLAYSAGGGGTTTILDLQNNGVSVWTNAADRPTLAGAASGKFVSGRINHSSVRVGDVLTLILATAGNKTKTTATVALEEP